MANEDDTASDVHNLTDFSDDEDPLRQHPIIPSSPRKSQVPSSPRKSQVPSSPRNSPRVFGTAKGSWYGDDHDQSPARRQLLNYRSPILQSGGRLA